MDDQVSISTPFGNELRFKIVYDDNINEYKGQQLFESKKLKAEISFKYSESNCHITEYYESGQIKRIYSLVDNKFGGIVLMYYKSGILKLEISYVDGKKTGSMKRYSKSGKLIQWKMFQDDKLHGISYEYHLSGDFKRKLEFYNGYVVDGDLYNTDGTARKMTHAHFENLGLSYREKSSMCITSIL